MLAGKPVLDSNNYIKDPVELSGCGIIVEPDSASAIVQGIHQLYNLTDLDRKAMGDKGRDYVRLNHNIRHLSDLYIRLFEQY
jgi:glycosyltransferase involved in cell wall biosynthesis